MFIWQYLHILILIQVNTNGAISFLRTLNTFTPLPFPLSDGRRIVAPFWADVDIRNGGDVFYRETTNSTILQRATDDVRVYVPSQIRFSAAWVFIATWDNVAFYGANSIGKTKVSYNFIIMYSWGPQLLSLSLIWILQLFC